ncbi:MAG: hypothetical protein HYY68_06630 [Thaumarchaeota archaeon]|nr:hypothetical protein [Nitrososphaerota archaeon]MBI3116041.1 hypothetical protein [Nitrososphaerota archaeon]
MVESKNEVENPFDKFAAGLREVQSEVAQLSELDEMERTYSIRLIDSIKLLQSQIDVAIPLHVNLLSTYQSNLKTAFLVSEGVVVLTDKDGTTLSLPLTQFKPQDILAVVQDATPALREIISEKRKLVGGRVDILERILKDMKKAGSSMKQSKRDAMDASEDDLIRSSLTNE